jgi:hypothetical protein
VIPENLPEYVDRGGRQVWRPPYTARDTEAYGFVVPCHRTAIDALLRRDLNEPSRGAVDYRCAHEDVVVLFAKIDRLSSADQRDSQRGYVSEREVSVWCIAADVLAGGRLVWYLPYVFVDSGQAAASGREVYGYPKQMAVFEDDFPARLADHGTTTTTVVEAQAIAQYGPNQEAVPQRMVTATRAAGQGLLPGLLHPPPPPPRAAAPRDAARYARVGGAPRDRHRCRPRDRAGEGGRAGHGADGQSDARLPQAVP